MRLLSFVSVGLLGLAVPGRAAMVFVHAAAPGPVHDGLSWATAWVTVQAGVAAAPGDEVWAAAGTYTGPLHLPPSPALCGGFNGTETTRDQRNAPANPTILQNTEVSAPPDATNVLHGLSFQKSTLSSRAGLTVSHCLFDSSRFFQAGGTLALTDNVFKKGDVALAAVGANVTIHRNTISGYSVMNNFFDTSTASIGGGLNLVRCTGEVSENMLASNFVGGFNARMIYGGGGGLCAAHCTLFIHRNVITSNSAGMYGYDVSSAEGGGVLGEGGFLVLSGNLITGNTVQSSGLMVDGGGAGVYLRNESAILANNTVVGNTASLQGELTATVGGSVYIVTSSDAASAYQAENDIVAFNDAGVEWNGPAPTWSHNNVFGNGQNYPKNGPSLTGTNGSIAVDPLFVDRAHNDFHLRPASPGIDAGNDRAGRDAYDLDGMFPIQGAHLDMGAYEYPVSQRLTVADVARALRIIAGIAPANAFDMGRLDGDRPQGRLDVLDAASLMRNVTGLAPNP